LVRAEYKKNGEATELHDPMAEKPMPRVDETKACQYGRDIWL